MKPIASWLTALFASSPRWSFWMIGCALLAATSSGIRSAQAQVLVRPPVPKSSLIQAQGLQLAADAVRLAQFGQTEEALARLQLATELVPSAPELQVILGSLQLQLNQYPEAIKTLLKARELAPDNTEILTTLGSAYIRQGSYVAAVDVLKKAIEIKPEDPNAHFQLGNAYLQRGEGYDAQERFEQAVKLDAKFWPALNNIGLVLYEQGKIDQAILKWQEAIKLNDKAAEPKLALATALYIQGKTKEAQKIGIAALQLDPDYGKVKILKDNLWGSRLLRDVQVLLRVPAVNNALRQAAAERPTRTE